MAEEHDELPEGWEEKRVAEICEPPQYGYTESAKNDPVGPRFLRITDIQNGGVNWDTVPYCLCNDADLEKYRLYPGDVLFARTGATTGKSFLVQECPESVFASYLIRLRPNKGIEPSYLYWFFQTPRYWAQVREGTTGSAQPHMNGKKLAEVSVLLPPLDEQRRIAARIDEFARRMAEINHRRSQMDDYAHQFLLGAYASISEDAPLMPMSEVAPLIRRPVKVEPDVAYHELGLRSFGKGTFHKPAIMGAQLGSKRIFHIEPGDLLFSNVFAWEGAIAVAKPEDKGRVGSHRYITCIAKEGVAKASYLCFHFLTERGLQQIGEASPGSAGRNRTLGLKALENIQVPVPSFEKQVWFDALVTKLQAIRTAQLETQKELDALMPSVLDRAFRGEL